MSNTATPKTPLDIDIYGVSKVTPYEVVIDTVDTDVTIHTPAAGNMVGIVVMKYADSTPHNLIMTSGSDTLDSYEGILGVDHSLYEGIWFIGAVGAAVKMQTSVVITKPIVVYVI